MTARPCTWPDGGCGATHPELGRCGGVAGHPAFPNASPSKEHGSARGWWNEETGYWQEWWQTWRPNPRSRWFPNGLPEHRERAAEATEAGGS